MTELHAFMIEAAAEAARVARGVGADPGRLSAPTPCGEWDTRTLLNHWILYTSHGLEHRALRRPLPEELTARDFTAAPDWAGAYAEQLDRAVAAWAAPEVWEGELDLGYEKMPAAEVASMIVKELAVHGWDVARATGQEYRCGAGLGAFVLEVVDRYAEVYRRYEGFAEPVTLPDPAAATAFERALALSGRTPAR
ncbi:MULTISPECIES: TIGR03086 family metal-binding protein [Streptomycetaceae]|uniref:TIGR03086 family metal-binding protein n=1 Tax=Streptomycetaceae TaxID=2062 RepID=UPI000360B2DB|nr:MULTISPECIES: TIGR03086 family metal-binding protein [Streptomycetaceae]MYX32400.1 TIGR03086 family protein [Streptomyces sp. SID8377]